MWLGGYAIWAACTTVVHCDAVMFSYGAIAESNISNIYLH